MLGLQEIPARSGKAVIVKKGQCIRVINTHGHQVVDFWAFNVADFTEFLSNEHMRQKLNSIFPKTGEPLYTNRRRPILVLEEDTSPGVHDTLMAACDIYRYQQLGCDSYHDNCEDNFRSALLELGFDVSNIPSPLNLWMNIPIDLDGECRWEPPVSRPGDYVSFRATMDTAVVMSACPQDLVPINAGQPVEAHFEVLEE